MDKLIETLLGVVVAVGASAALFVGANKWFDQTRSSWQRFSALTGGVIGALVMLILVGNRAMAWLPTGEGGVNLTWWLVPIAALLMGAWGYLISGRTSRNMRLIIGAGGGAVIGVVFGIFAKSDTFPAMKVLHLAIWPIVGAIIGVGLRALLKRRAPLRGAVTGALFGWVIGAFGVPSLGGGTRAEVVLGYAILLAGLGARIGLGERLSYDDREQLYRRSRAAIFVTPALAFVAWSLVIPTIRTIWLSLLDRRGEEWRGLQNYKAAFNDPNTFDVSDWPAIFTSSLFYWGVVALAIGVVAGRIMGRRMNAPFDMNGVSVGPIALGGFMIAFAAFAHLRGTILNNLWWIFAVTVVVTVLGLAVAVLADRSRMESVAKSLIFMPMAISFVGAAIIWRFMYIPRPAGRPQTGVLNALWVWLGQVSNSGGRLIAGIVLAVFIAALAYVAWRGYRNGANSLVIGSAVAVIPLLWLLYRFLGPGIGGFTIGPDGEAVPETIFFLQQSPWNNLWVMLPFMWIYTGFSMVIFSAAIKAVPSDLIEAAKVDGATESQTFWRVTVPQIFPTIGVVVTTLIVVVAKVFDIVKVMTNGNFDTQVLANEMWQRAFTELNFGLGSALAVLILVAVLPIMYYNIRTMQKEAKAT